MNSVIVIPARYGSSRFPGKPLALISGMAMIERTWRIAKMASADQVLITTDDDRIEAAAKSFGAEVVRTGDCANGSERVFEALTNITATPDIVLNLQGDAVLTPPWILNNIIDAMRADSSIQIATPATKLSIEQYLDLVNQKAQGIVGGTLVVFDKRFNAMYFSKSPIPFLRSNAANTPLYRHIGLYGYRYSALKQYLQLPVGELEKVEGLEQLRALENGVPIRIVVVDYRGRTHWSVDSPDDIERVEKIIAAQGELFQVTQH